MSKLSLKEKKQAAALSIDSAGLAAFYAIDTDDFTAAFANLISCFKKYYAIYLYADRGIDPDNIIFSSEDEEKNAYLENATEEISFYFEAGCMVLDINFVRNFNPDKSNRKLKFFDYLNYITSKQANIKLSANRIEFNRSGISGISESQASLLTAALKVLESIGDPTDAQLDLVAEKIGCEPEKFRKLWVQNLNSYSLSLDAGTENDEGDFTALIDTLTYKEETDTSHEDLEAYLCQLDRLLEYTRPKGVRAKDIEFELTAKTKKRFPLIFTNTLILEWIDIVRDSDPDITNREMVLRQRFDHLELPKKKELFAHHLCISPLIFDLYIRDRKELTIGALAEIEQVDQSAFSDMVKDVVKKLHLFLQSQQ